MLKYEIRRILPVLLSLILLLLLTCPAAFAAENGATDGADLTAPHTRPDGGKYRIAYIDYDEYPMASRQLYYILAGMEELGWIYPGRLPFSAEDVENRDLTTKQMVASMAQTDLGPFISFDDNLLIGRSHHQQLHRLGRRQKAAGDDSECVIDGVIGNRPDDDVSLIQRIRLITAVGVNISEPVFIPRKAVHIQAFQVKFICIQNRILSLPDSCPAFCDLRLGSRVKALAEIGVLPAEVH